MFGIIINQIICILKAVFHILHCAVVISARMLNVLPITSNPWSASLLTQPSQFTRKVPTRSLLPDCHVARTPSVIRAKTFQTPLPAYGMNWLMYGSIYHREEHMAIGSHSSFYLA
jgi:hypothetical protein